MPRSDQGRSLPAPDPALVARFALAAAPATPKSASA